MTLFETSNQALVLFVCISSGFLCGILFDIGNIVCFLCKQNKIVKICSDFVCTTLCFFVAFLICYTLNYGVFRLYIPLSFFAFVYLERITLGKLVAKTYKWCYTLFEKFSQRIANIFARKTKDGTKKEK